MIATATATPIGGTFTHDGRRVHPRRGYAVGIRAFPTLRAAFEAARPGYHVGYWVDEETGRAYYDIVMIVEDEEKAREMGERHKQIAIWSFADGCEIRLQQAA